MVGPSKSLIQRPQVFYARVSGDDSCRSQHALSTGRLNTPSQFTISIHLINAPIKTIHPLLPSFVHLSYFSGFQPTKAEDSSSVTMSPPTIESIYSRMVRYIKPLWAAVYRDNNTDAGTITDRRVPALEVGAAPALPPKASSNRNNDNNNEPSPLSPAAQANVSTNGHLVVMVTDSGAGTIPTHPSSHYQHILSI